MSDQKKTCTSPLLRLPLELRLPIYKELLAPSDESKRVLCSCRDCQIKKMHMLQTLAADAPRPIFPAILATNKMIYEEGMTTLYGENNFVVVCSGTSTAPSNIRISGFREIKSLVLLKGANRNVYLKRVSLTFACHPRDYLENLPSMWSNIESMMLDYYPSIERIRVGFLQIAFPRRVFMSMVRKQQQKPKGRICADRYFNTLKMRQDDSNWAMKQLCDVILPVELPELFVGSAFLIQSLQWWDSGESGETEEQVREVEFI